MHATISLFRISKIFLPSGAVYAMSFTETMFWRTELVRVVRFSVSFLHATWVGPTLDEIVGVIAARIATAMMAATKEGPTWSQSMTKPF